MSDRVPPNPYMEGLPSQLADLAMGRARDLLGEIPVGRRDTAYMLIAAGHALRPRIGGTGEPFARVQQDHAQALAAYGALLEEGQRSLRWRVMKVAMEAAGWPDIGARDRLASRGIDSDAACREVLVEIAGAKIGP